MRKLRERLTRCRVSSLRKRLTNGGVLSLRKRLVLSVTGLLAAASLAIGIALPLILKGFLIDRVDEQLTAAADRASRFGNGSPDDRGGGGSPAGLVQPGQAVGTIAALVVNGYVTDCGTLDRDGQPASCDFHVVGAIAEGKVTSEPTTLDLHKLGPYRVVAVQTDDGLFITGLPLENTRETVARLIIIEVIVAGTVLVVAAAVSAAMIGSMLRPLRRVASTATRVSELPLARGEVDLAERVAEADADPRTEVGQVGHAFNQMLSHVGNALSERQQSEQRVRSFVADASHELRTPLAAIRGYAELTRRSRDQVPDDVAHALTRVESESLRMTTLVEDLLLLARLDSGRPLERKPVDLAALLIAAVSDAHAAGRDYEWKLELPDEPLEVPGDEARLHQVVANLLANARTHTPPGTVVTTSLATSPDGQSALIQVRDNGPGIPADLVPTVFDRFARGDSSRSREKGSTGLGLAIVSAVIGSHRGRVSVDSSPGSTVFTVSLPIRPPQQPQP